MLSTKIINYIYIWTALLKFLRLLLGEKRIEKGKNRKSV